MKEIACQFGDQQHLVGVMTKPENVDINKPTFIFINAGLLSKIGPHRLYVLMARSLAKLGFMTLRFDLSGIGDSADIGLQDKTLEQRKIADIQSAMDYIAEIEGCKKFVLSGLCSGAEDSFRSAVEDSRVSGLYLIDANAYETKKSKIRFNLTRPLRKTLKLLGWYTKKDKTNSEVISSVDIDFLEALPREESESKLKQLLSRQVKIKYVFTGGVYHNYNYKNQIYDMYDIEKTDLIEVEMYPNMGHLPLLVSDKVALIDSITGWANRNLISTN